jgi:hypothetical protein
MLASAAGAFAAYAWMKFRFGAPDVSWLCNGMLAGMVAITAPCAFVTAPSAVLIGAIAGVLVCAAVFIVPPMDKSAMIADEAGHDTRLVAGRWMDAHIPAGSRIVVVEHSSYLPAAKGWDSTWHVEHRRKNYNPGAKGKPVPYFVISSFGYDRYLDSPNDVPKRTAYYRTVMKYHLVKSFEPKWLSYGKHSPEIKIYRPTAP